MQIIKNMVEGDYLACGPRSNILVKSIGSEKGFVYLSQGGGNPAADILVKVVRVVISSVIVYVCGVVILYVINDSIVYNSVVATPATISIIITTTPSRPTAISTLT